VGCSLLKARMGIVGLGTMGENLALNIAGRGFPVSVYNRTAERTKEFVSRLDGSLDVRPTFSIKELVDSLERPRQVLLMVTAGSAVDSVFMQLAEHLSEGDIVIDGGNSYFKDTERRFKEAAKRKIAFMGVGISGGEEGALKGPCIMAGGPIDAYMTLEPVFSKIAARIESGPCCAYLGPGGAGHYTKMVHNGIEYALLEVIAEVYDVQLTGLGLDTRSIRENFAEWDDEDLQSYLLDITKLALSKEDPETGRPLVEMISDRTGQKGTGKWASQTALDLGVPTPTIDAGVSSRNLSTYREERLKAAAKYNPEKVRFRGDGRELVEALRDALRCSFIVSYAQGFDLLRAGSENYGYSLPLAVTARIWRGGCIIRARLLERFERALASSPSLRNLLLDDAIASTLKEHEGGWRKAVLAAKSLGIPVPALSSALDYYDAFRREKLPSNLIQALRDIFGAHTYERVDRPGSFHTIWS
jgi:6-phosphogluconate dehydrogenase